MEDALKMQMGKKLSLHKQVVLEKINEENEDKDSIPDIAYSRKSVRDRQA